MSEQVSELMPCPFCGQRQVYVNQEQDIFEVECKHGGCPASIVMVTALSKSEAVSKWNQRASSSPLLDDMLSIITIKGIGTRTILNELLARFRLDKECNYHVQRLAEEFAKPIRARITV